MTHHISYSELFPKLFTGQHLVTLQIFVDGLVHDFLWQCPVVIRVCFQPVTGKLFVERRLTMSCFISFCRPEPGTVRCKHLITDHHVSFCIQSKLELGICDDDSFTQCILCTFFIQRDGVVTKFFSQFLSSSREVFFQMSYALFKRNILIVITDLCFGRRGVNRLRQFIGFFQSFRKFNATDFSGFLIALPVIYPRTMHSIGSISSFRHIILLPLNFSCWKNSGISFTSTEII